MENIQIKCRACGQKFSVSDSYMGRTVECGICDELFEVNEDSLAKKRKSYPGEKSSSPTQTFKKAAPASNTNDLSTVNFQTASYNHVDYAYAQPRKTIKTFMIIAGILLIIGFGILLFMGVKGTGALATLEHSKQLILAGFVALIGSLLLIVGTRNKIKGLFTSVILGGGMVAIPLLLSTEQAPDDSLTTTSNSSNQSTTLPSTASSNRDEFSQKLEAYKLGIGYDHIDKLRKEASKPDQIKAILLHDSKVQYLDTITSYLERVLGPENSLVTYPYGREIDGEEITLLTMKTDKSMDDLVKITKKFGTPLPMDPVHEALKVFEVEVDQDTLEPLPEGHSTDQLHPEYFNANYNELKSIDRTRQMNAAKRLEPGTHLGRQSDMSLLLAELIDPNDHELSAQFIATLNNWTRPEYETNQKVLDYAKQIAGTTNMSRPVMDYLTKRDIPGSTEVLSKQWASPKGDLLWAEYLVKAKARGEQAVIDALPTVDQSHYKSAASILSRIGTRKSLPALNNVLSKASNEDKKYLKAVIDEIKSRQ